MTCAFYALAKTVNDVPERLLTMYPVCTLPKDLRALPESLGFRRDIARLRPRARRAVADDGPRLGTFLRPLT
jgi:hypothetical protein